jgi:hypothetical protein
MTREPAITMPRMLPKVEARTRSVTKRVPERPKSGVATSTATESLARMPSMPRTRT